LQTKNIGWIVGIVVLGVLVAAECVVIGVLLSLL